MKKYIIKVTQTAVNKNYVYYVTNVTDNMSIQICAESRKDLAYQFTSEAEALLVAGYKKPILECFQASNFFKNKCSRSSTITEVIELDEEEND